MKLDHAIESFATLVALILTLVVLFTQYVATRLEALTATQASDARTVWALLRQSVWATLLLAWTGLAFASGVPLMVESIRKHAVDEWEHAIRTAFGFTWPLVGVIVAWQLVIACKAWKDFASAYGAKREREQTPRTG